jgi:hypothetical protein
MPKQVHITTPWPTSAEEARRLRIPKRRQKELNALADELVRQLRKEKEASADKAVNQGKKRKNASAAA